MRNKTDTLKEKYFIGKNPFKYLVDKISSIDIDEYEDYKLVRFILSLNGEKSFYKYFIKRDI